MKIRVKASGSSNGRVWVVPQSLPLTVGIQLVPVADLSDFANVITAAGTAPAVPAAGTEIEVAAINIRRYHRREGEGEGEAAVYSPTPSFALELIVA